MYIKLSHPAFLKLHGCLILLFISSSLLMWVNFCQFLIGNSLKIWRCKYNCIQTTFQSSHFLPGMDFYTLKISCNSRKSLDPTWVSPSTCATINSLVFKPPCDSYFFHHMPIILCLFKTRFYLCVSHSPLKDVEKKIT